MLNITFDGVSVTPNRSDDPNTFGSADCPDGTLSVFVKAAQVLRHSVGKTAVSYPSLDADAIEALVVAKISGIEVKQSHTEFVDATAMDLVTRDDYVASLDVETMVELPSASDIQAKIDAVRGFSQVDVDRKREDYWDLDEDGNIQRTEEDEIMFTKTESEVMDMLRKTETDHITMITSTVADLSDADAQTALEDDLKRELATGQVNVSLSKGLEVGSDIEAISSGSATVVGTTISDSSGSLVTDSVEAGDFVKCGGKLAKVVSVTDENDMELDREDMDGETDSAYSVIRSAFMSQFEFNNSTE
jgi:hypothetical protein